MNKVNEINRFDGKRHNTWQSAQKFFHLVDKNVFKFLRNWSTLMAAILGVGLCAWGFWRVDINLVIEVLLSGAVGYVIGFLPAIIGDLVLLIIRLHESQFPYHVFPIELLQFFGCAYIAWLGYQHHLLAYVSRQQRIDEHSSHIISWSAVNEVRNSLLAMRLLLFQHTKKDAEQEDFKLVESELLRLEYILGSLSKAEEDKKPLIKRDFPNI